MVMAKENVFKGVDWSEAPEWANYWTCNQNFGANWWKERPVFNETSGFWHSNLNWISTVISAANYGFPGGGRLPGDSLVSRPRNLAKRPTEDASWLWYADTGDSGGCFSTEAEAARDAIKHFSPSKTFYVAQVTRVIKPFKRSATA